MMRPPVSPHTHARRAHGQGRRTSHDASRRPSVGGGTADNLLWDCQLGSAAVVALSGGRA